MDPFEHDEDESVNKGNLPPSLVQDHHTDVRVLSMDWIVNDLCLSRIEWNQTIILKWFLIVVL